MMVSILVEKMHLTLVLPTLYVYAHVCASVSASASVSVCKRSRTGQFKTICYSLQSRTLKPRVLLWLTQGYLVSQWYS